MIAVVAGSSDYYFLVHGAAGHTITVKKGSTEVSTIPPTSSTCERTISTTKQTVGPAPPGTWPIAVYGPNDELIVCEDDRRGRVVLGHCARKRHHRRQRADRRGAGRSGVHRARTRRTRRHVHGVAVPDHGHRRPAGDPRDRHEHRSAARRSTRCSRRARTRTPNRRRSRPPSRPRSRTPVPLPDPGPEQPTVPDGAPDPPPGPDLVPAQPGGPAADLVVTHTVSPRRIVLGQTVETVTRVRNPARWPRSVWSCASSRSIRRRIAARVARVLSVSATAGSCRAPRPVRCELGTLQPGQTVVIRSRAQPLVTGPLQTVVFASSETPERNTTNNLAGSWIAGPAPVLPAARAGQRAPHGPRGSGAELPSQRGGHAERGHTRRTPVHADPGLVHGRERARHVRLPRPALPRLRGGRPARCAASPCAPCRRQEAESGCPAWRSRAIAQRSRAIVRRCRSPPVPAPPRCGVCAADLRRALRGRPRLPARWRTRSRTARVTTPARARRASSRAGSNPAASTPSPRARRPRTTRSRSRRRTSPARCTWGTRSTARSRTR